MRHAGLQPGDPVILLLTHNQDILSGFWGCVLGGFVPVIMSPPQNAGCAPLCGSNAGPAQRRHIPGGDQHASALCCQRYSSGNCEVAA
ncbi:MAG: hypothetical protein D3904_09010 [Candidatus Electrothrix sp. EH2]|nr:hypothetical protein [Candidatus Electrothrix sp. EH2]